MKVKLVGVSSITPLGMSEFAGKTCYQNEMPNSISEEEEAEKFVREKLFLTSHHTTLEHTNFTFFLEDIPVSDVTLGLHLAHPFYNSDQRSGRYCSKMFTSPDFGAIRAHIISMWPELTPLQIEKVIGFIKTGTEIYANYLEKAVEVTAKLLRKERPHLSEKGIMERAPKIAQEQFRMFISTIFPTGLVHTIDLITLVSIWESAWSPGMRKMTDMMRDHVLERFPQTSFMFDEDRRRKDDWACALVETPPQGGIIAFSPKVTNVRLDISRLVKLPDEKIMHPVDKLHFTPEFMNNNTNDVLSRVQISLATMGQDQRHRTIKRSEPAFTGEFYLPPVCQVLGIQEIAEKFFRMWLEMRGSIPASLFCAIAPYGAVVTYEKKANLNAFFHEIAKRFCWQAQEEIYNLNILLKRIIELQYLDSSNILAKMIPPCFHSGNGTCTEGGRCCGRNMKNRESDSRKV